MIYGLLLTKKCAQAAVAVSAVLMMFKRTFL